MILTKGQVIWTINYQAADDKILAYLEKFTIESFNDTYLAYTYTDIIVNLHPDGTELGDKYLGKTDEIYSETNFQYFVNNHINGSHRTIIDENDIEHCIIKSIFGWGKYEI